MSTQDFSSLDVRQLFLSSDTVGAGLAANAEIFHFRWNNQTQRVIVPRVRISAASTGTGFTAGSVNFSLYRASAWTAAGSGGTSMASSINDGRGKINSLVAQQSTPEIRFATTAALGQGTKTVESTSLGGIQLVTGTGTYSQLATKESLFEDIGTLLRPLEFGYQEGFVIRVNVPATGTWAYGVEVAWAPF